MTRDLRTVQSLCGFGGIPLSGQIEGTLLRHSWKGKVWTWLQSTARNPRGLLQPACLPLPREAQGRSLVGGVIHFRWVWVEEGSRYILI